MTFSVQINDSSKYIVRASGILGAVKAALQARAEIEADTVATDAVRIEVTPITKGKA